MTIDDQVQEAVEAVRARDRRTRNYFLAAIVVFLVSIIVGGIVMTSILLGQTRTLKAENAALERQGDAIAQVLGEADNQRAALEHILCLVTLNQKVLLIGVRHLAHKFGVSLPEVPNVVTRCENGKDDVFLGTSGSDYIKGTGRADFINAAGGNDIVRANAGDDAVFGQNGNDRLSGGYGSDHLNGDSGDDKLFSGTPDGAVDVLDGGEGKDRCVIRANDTTANCEKVVTRG